MNDDILVGLAAASIFKLVAVDRITQPARYGTVRWLRRHPSSASRYAEYLMGCALCLPLWAAAFVIVSSRWRWGRLLSRVLVGRMVGYALLRWLNETGVRDWPDGLEWPPADPEDHSE